MITTLGKATTSLKTVVFEDSSTSSTFLKEHALGKATKKLDESEKGDREKQVRFGTIEINEHAIALGESSIPRCGPPLTTHWERQARYLVTVDDYEASKPPARKGDQLLYSKRERNNM